MLAAVITITITRYWLILTLNINIIIIVVDLLLTKIPSWLMKLKSQIKWGINNNNNYNNNIFKHLTLPTLGSLQQIIYAKKKLEGLIKMQIQICSKSPGSCWCSQYRRIQDPGEQVTTDRWANNRSLFPPHGICKVYRQRTTVKGSDARKVFKNLTELER